MSTDQQEAAKTRVEQHRLYESRLFAGFSPAYKVLLCNALGDDTFKIGLWPEEKLRLKDAHALADNGESKFKISDETADETSWAQNTDGAVDTVEGSDKSKSRNVPADFDLAAKSTKVMAFINYAAHNAVRLVVQDPSNTNISEKYKEEMK